MYSVIILLTLIGGAFSLKTSLSKRVSTQLNDVSLLTSVLQKVDPNQAKKEFYFFFFGGSGALGIGAAQIPKLLKDADALKALGGGVSLGGDNLDISPLATIGYPESLKIKDIQTIIDKVPSADALLKLGPKKTYLAQMGYIEKVAFDQALSAYNPLAKFAIFEAISGGGGAGVASPVEFTSKIAAWKGENGIELFKSDLLKSSIKKYSAFTVFAFLIALVLDLIVESGINAWL